MNPAGTLPSGAEGATINGRPALTVESVQQWFCVAFKAVPDAHAVAPIAQAINHCTLFESQWKRTPKFDEVRRNNPSTLRVHRIAKALATLQNDLPELVKDTPKATGDKQSEGLAAVEALLNAANLLAPGFQTFLRRSAGRGVDPWHRIARNLRPPILEALRSSGVTRAGFGKITSPAVEIVKSAPAYLGVRSATRPM